MREYLIILYDDCSATFASTLSDATIAQCNMRKFSTKLKRETNYTLITMVIIGDWDYQNFLKR